MTDLHPWHSTPEALQCAQKAVQASIAMMAKRGFVVGADELLLHEALTILTECALPPRERASLLCRCLTPLSVSHACNADTLSKRTSAHIGSMWKWPEDRRAHLATRQVAYCLNNYARWRELEAGKALVA